MCSKYWWFSKKISNFAYEKHINIHTMKQTKIVASISDRRCDVEFLRKLFLPE